MRAPMRFDRCSASVRLALGSDFWNGTSATEAAFLAQEPLIQGVAPLGVFDNFDLVRFLSMDTPRTIFPDRRIGGLADGDEANFVVLEGHLIASLRNLFEIGMRVHARASIPARRLRVLRAILGA